ncbi:hypothetical protein SMICM17S_07407 [Streptomyces microflavus]
MAAGNLIPTGTTPERHDGRHVRRPAVGVAGYFFLSMWRELAPSGATPKAAVTRRYAWSAADLDCRAWFRTQAEARGLTYERDRNGNQWAWLGDPLAGDAVVTGSHLDSVPDGGAFDGPLGVVSSFAALDELHSRSGVHPPLGDHQLR